MSTLKEILNSVMDDAFEEREASYATNSQSEYQRLVRFANKAIEDILTQYDWGLLKRRGTIAVVDGTTLYDLPDDYSYMINDTANTESGFRDIELPASDQIVAYDDSWSRIGYMVRILGNQVEIKNGDEGNMNYMYMTNHVVRTASGNTTSNKFTADNDEWLLDDELLIRGILWRWQRAEGDDASWQVSLSDFTNHLENMKGRDTAARVINSDISERYKNLPFWVKYIQ